MEISHIVILIAICFAVLCLFSIVFLARSKKTVPDPQQQQISNTLLQLNQNIQTLQSHQQRDQQDLSKKMYERDTKNAEIIGSLNNKLSTIEKAQGNITNLSNKIVDLQHLLDNRHARGAFGEDQLEDQIRETLPPSAYKFQHQLSNNCRVDCLLSLPSPNAPLSIDAKFPLEGFRLLNAARSKEEEKSARNNFARDIKQHIKKIAESYILPGETADKALMFIPSQSVFEAIYSELAPTVAEANKMNIFLASPTTLMVLLHSIKAFMKDTKILEHATMIKNEIELLGQDIGRLNDRVKNLNKHYDAMGKDMNEITISAKKIDSRAEKFDSLAFDETPDEVLPAPTSLK